MFGVFELSGVYAYLALSLDNGKIVEEGSHDELLRRRGAYYQFYQLQSLNK